MDKLIEAMGQLIILCGKKVDEVLAIGEQVGLLLTLDGVAELLRRLQVAPHLILARGVDVKVGKMAERDAVLVCEL